MACFLRKFIGCCTRRGNFAPRIYTKKARNVTRDVGSLFLLVLIFARRIFIILPFAYIKSQLNGEWIEHTDVAYGYMRKSLLTDLHLSLKAFLAAVTIIDLSRVVLVHHLDKFAQYRRVLSETTISPYRYDPDCFYMFIQEKTLRPYRFIVILLKSSRSSFCIIQLMTVTGLWLEKIPHGANQKKCV